MKEILSYRQYVQRLEDAKYELHKIENETLFTISNNIWLNIASQQETFRSMFEEVGFPPGYMTAIENRYWPKVYEESQVPWYEYHCTLGVITIGWRKKVISIHWPSDGKTAKIETQDNVTHQYYKDGMIHAWSLEKAQEYLGLILRALKEANA